MSAFPLDPGLLASAVSRTTTYFQSFSSRNLRWNATFADIFRLFDLNSPKMSATPPAAAPRLQHGYSPAPASLAISCERKAG